MIHTFRFDPHSFQSRFRSVLEPRKPRHRIMRVLLGVVGLAMLAVLVMFSVAVGAAMLVAGLCYRLWRGRARPLGRKADDGVLDAEYRVVGKPMLSR